MNADHDDRLKDFATALRRLVDDAMGDIDSNAIIDLLEGRIGVVRERAEMAEEDNEDVA